MIKVLVSSVVVAGTDRGGEDLFIKFTASTTERPTLNYGLNDIEIEVGDDIDEIDGVLSVCTEAYEFEWEGTRDAIKERVLPFLNSDEYIDGDGWISNLKGTKFIFTLEDFVDGNAD